MNPKSELAPVPVPRPTRPIMTPRMLLELSIKQKDQLGKYIRGMRAYFEN